jgi:hypothetical protein
LKDIQTGADVLHTVQCLVGLATSKSPLNETTKLKESLEEIGRRPSTYFHEIEPVPAPDPIYSAVQFHNVETQIRLINVLPGQPENPLKIELFAVDSVTAQPYEALSYVWGPRDADVMIEVNGKSFEVAANLHGALSCLRQIEERRVLWVDAICINQIDDLEKSSQVSLMGNIYRNAAGVVIFLGKEKDDSAMIMQYLDLEDIEEPEIELPEPEPPGSKPLQPHETEKDIKDARIIQARIKRCGFDSARFLNAADAFFKRSWWSRIWTVQEFALAKIEPRWYCGRTWTSTGHMRHRVGKLSTFLINEAKPLVGNVEVFTSAQVDVGRQFITIAERRWTMNMQLADRKAQRPSHFMIRLLYRQSTDPRDRIYGLREMLDPISKQVFTPDYAVSADDVFLKLTSYFLSHDQFGHIYDLYETNRSSDISSWVLDFTRPFSLHGVWHLSAYYGEDVPWVKQSPSSLSIRAPWAKNNGRLSIYKGVLSIMGVEIDCVDHIAYLEDETDIRRLGLVWKLEGTIQKCHPSRALSDLAARFVPRSCIVPFPPPLTKHFNSLGSESVGTQFPTTYLIPGYLHFHCEITKLQLLLAPMSRPKNLTCEKWPKAASLGGWEQVYGRVSRLMAAIREAVIAESFLGGACFDFSNLKKQIMSVTLPERDPRESVKDTKSTGEKSSQDKKGRTAEGGDYVPHYLHVKNVLLQARDQQELDTLKDTTIQLAEICCSIVSLHLAKQGPPGTKLFPELKASLTEYYVPKISAYRELSENCTCEGDARARHQEILQELIAAAEKGRVETEASVEEIQGLWKMEGYDLSTELYMTIRKQYTSMFVTRLGLFGTSFQRQAGFKNGCKVVVLDGIPAPMVLEETGDGVTYRMKGAAHVVGITHIDIDKLVELGVFKRRRFHIV